MTWPRFVLGAVLFLVAVYAVLLVWIYLRQEALLFHPEPLPESHRFARGQDVHERTVAVPGANLSVLELRLANPKGVVFFLHGNAGNLESWFVNVDLYRELNYDLVMLDYRGYGKSTGTIESEAQLRSDVRAVWDSVSARYADKIKVIYGRSLGTALATGLAREVQPDLTVLVSPYISMVELAREHYPLVPSWLLRYPLHTAADIAAHRSPLLLIHGDRDTLIRPTHSEHLRTLAPHAQLLRLPQADHGDVHEFETYIKTLSAALGALPSAVWKR